MNIQSLAETYLATFSGVGGGKSSGVNKEAFFIFPLIFIFPYKNKLFNVT